MGPRLGRFTKDGRPIPMPGHSVPLAALGGFILLFGFLAFNGGSQVYNIYLIVESMNFYFYVELCNEFILTYYFTLKPY